MVLEIARIEVFAGYEEAFVTSYQLARPLLAASPGCLSVRMTQGVEHPTTFALLVEWESVEAHEENFVKTERFAQWRELIGPSFAKPPVVEHFLDLPPGERPGPDIPPGVGPGPDL